jgi:hypothetical protein
MLQYHARPEPDACDVCRYAVEHALDCGYEHARTRVATAFLLEDLEELHGATTRLSSLAVAEAGFEPGSVHPLEPRHWFWAMFHEPRIRVSLEE